MGWVVCPDSLQIRVRMCRELYAPARVGVYVHLNVFVPHSTHLVVTSLPLGPVHETPQSHVVAALIQENRQPTTVRNLELDLDASAQNKSDVCQFSQKSVIIAKSLERSQKESRIDHAHLYVK